MKSIFGQNNKINYCILIFITIFYTLSASTFAMSTACDRNSTNLVFGKLWENTIWTKENSPYFIGNDVIVEKNITLTIEPGVSIFFCKGTELNADETFSIIINGKLKAKGTSDSLILFSSGRANQEPEDWNSIKFSNISDQLVLDNDGKYLEGSILENVIFEYGSKVLDLDTPIYLNNFTVKDSKGIRINCDQIITELNFFSNSGGIGSNSILKIFNSNFISNLSGGISSSKSVVIDYCNFEKNKYFYINIGSETNSLISNSIFKDNEIIGYWGGTDNDKNSFIISNGNLTIKDSIFKDNYVSYDRRASLLNSNSQLIIQNTDFINSYFRAIESKGTVFIENSYFSDLFQIFYSEELGSSISVNNSRILNSNYAIESTGTIDVSNTIFYNIEQKTIITQDLKIKNSLFYECHYPITSNNYASISNCTFSSDNGNDRAVDIRGEKTNIQIKHNNFIGNQGPYAKYFIYNDTANDFNAMYNYWGFTSSSTIYKTIYDKRHNIEKGLVTFEPFLDKYNTNTPDHPSVIKISPVKNFFIFESNNMTNSNIKSFIIVNDGKSNLSIKEIISNNDSEDIFNVIFDSCSNKSFSSSESCTITFLYKPINERFIRSKFHISTNAINQKSIDSYIDLIGYIPDESFETNDFNKFKWVKSREDEWIIQDTVKFTGKFSASSIINEELSDSSYIELTLNVMEGDIIFNLFTNAACRFYIDNKKHNIYGSGKKWKSYSYHVESGIRRFKWEQLITDNYLNDFYIDSIKFPPLKEDNLNDCFVNIEPSTFDFGQVFIDSEKQKEFLVTNNCSVDLQIKNIVFKIDDPNFAITSNSCIDRLLNPNISCLFEVTFSPIAEGFKKNQLMISSDTLESIIEVSGMTPITISGNVELNQIAGYDKLFVKNAEVLLSGIDYQYSTNTDINGKYELFLESFTSGIHQLLIKSEQLEPIIRDINIDDKSMSIDTIFMECKKCCNENEKVTIESILYDLQVLSGCNK